MCPKMAKKEQTTTSAKIDEMNQLPYLPLDVLTIIASYTTKQDVKTRKGLSWCPKNSTMPLQMIYPTEGSILKTVQPSGNQLTFGT